MNQNIQICQAKVKEVICLLKPHCDCCLVSRDLNIESESIYKFDKDESIKLKL